MGITVDPLEFIKDWVGEKWNAGSVGFTPSFGSKPYKTGMNLPHISIKEIRARPDHLNLGSTYHLYYDIYAINLWDTDKDKIWKMRQEVRRIVYAYQKAPTTTTYPSPGIASILIYEEFPQDLDLARPPVLSRSVRVMVRYLETNA